MPLEVHKIDVLVHPFFSSHHAPKEIVDELLSKWKQRVDRVANDNRRVMVLVKTPNLENGMYRVMLRMDEGDHGATAHDELVKYATQKLVSRLLVFKQNDKNVGMGIGGKLAEKYSLGKVSVIGYGEFANQCVATALYHVARDLTEKGVRVKKAGVRLDRSIGFHQRLNVGEYNAGNPVGFDKAMLERYREQRLDGEELAQTKAVIEELKKHKCKRKQLLGV